MTNRGPLRAVWRVMGRLGSVLRRASANIKLKASKNSARFQMCVSRQAESSRVEDQTADLTRSRLDNTKRKPVV